MRRCCPLLCALLAAPLPLWSQAAAPPSPYDHAADAPVVRAARLTGSIRVDGKLDEAAWAAATPATHFTQFDPVEGAAPTQPTEVRILIGDDALYIGARMFDNPTNVRARLTRRDEPVDGDIFAVSIDSRHDHLTAFYFRVTAGGAIRDAVVNGSNNNLDLSWDAVWDAAANVDSLGWTAELRIPLSQLQYSRTNSVWGIQFERYGWNKQEQDFFAFTPKKEQQGVQRFGHLEGLGDLPSPSRLELAPYVSSRAEYTRTAPADPFRSNQDYSASVGADVKYRVTSNLTLTGTVNPDFGQVELDPAVVNLTAFETQFQEKRPFFVQGQELFGFGTIRAFNRFGAPSLFFSRRIGRQPHLQPGGPGFSFVDAPDQSTIAAAGKLTGKTASGWSTALLDAVTTQEEARYVDAGGLQQSMPVEPLSNYLVARVRRELRGGNTQFGGLFTAVQRDFRSDALRSLLPAGAYVGGVDLNHAWGGQRWLLDAAFAGSMVRGSTDAIALEQQSSARYYQRPDAQSVQFDPTRTSLSGYTAQASLTKASGLHWVGSLAYQDISPGFESNDLGFQSNADRRGVSTLIGYQEHSPGRLFRSWTVDAFTNQWWNRDGDILFNTAAAEASVDFHNFSGLQLRTDLSPSVFDDRLTRGGPVARVPSKWDVRASYFSDRRKRYLTSWNASYTHDQADQHTLNANVDLTLQILPNASIELAPEFVAQHSESQFIGQVDDASATATFGQGYLFSRLDYRELGIVTRLNWTFTPRLSFQLFAQPFVGAGNFQGVRELAAPRTFEFRPYADSASIPNLDFNQRSLRGNAVLRWEYRPGSTFYLVWTQRRFGEEPFGDFTFRRDYGAIGRLHPENVFAVKMSYWIAP